jgi:hypothetical protein
MHCRYIRTLFLIALLILTPAISANSQNTNSIGDVEKAIDHINKKGDFYASVSLKDASIAQDHLQKHASVDFLSGDSIYAYFNTRALGILLENNIPFQIVKSPGEVDFDLNMKTWEDLLSKDLIDTWDFYPTYEAYESLMYQFQADFPELCKVYNIVTLASGRSIFFTKLSANVNESEAKPRFMYTSTMHGDETTGFILSLRLIHHLLTNYGVNDELTWFLDNMEIWISPNENPDGTYTNNNNTVSGATRSNANGVDLNRNYPNPVNDPSSAIQAETQAMMNLTDTLHFVMSANMHGGIECVNYPWDSWTSNNNLHADTDWWLLVSHEYADTARYYSPPTYMNPSGSSFNNGVTHGGDWYVVYGSRQDFMNYYRNQRELTLELSNTKLLPPAQLPAHWEYNYRSFLNYIRQAAYGIRGTVSDLYSGEPLQAKIEIIDHDTDNTHVFSEMPHGDFYRPVLAGTYDLLVSAEGYNSTVIENVTLGNYESIELNIQLEGDNPFAPPANLVAHTGNNSQVYLEWDAPEPPGTSRKNAKDYVFYEPEAYHIFRNGEFLDVAESTFYFDTEIPLGTWEYFVRAWYADPEGLSHPSNSVTVTFSEPVFFTISATAGENGIIEPAGEIQVQKGYSKSFQMIPDQGYMIDEIYVDGNVLPDPGETYVFTNVQSDHTIHAEFTEFQQPVFSVTFNVYDQDSQSVHDAYVSLDGQQNPMGDYHFMNIAAGIYDYMVWGDNYLPAEGIIEVEDSDVLEDVVLLFDDTGLTEITTEHNFRLFPNPASGHLYIESDVIMDRIVLNDISGRQLKAWLPENQEFDLDISGYSPGIYLIGIFTDHDVVYRKLQIQ